MATLLVDRNSSKCSECNHGADPRETSHITRLDYGDHDGRGCGATYNEMMAVCVYPGVVEAMRDINPYLNIVAWS